LKPAWANSSKRPHLETLFTKNRAGGVAGCLSSSPSTAKRKKKKEEKHDVNLLGGGEFLDLLGN
jgi:hypothetical protein